MKLFFIAALSFSIVSAVGAASKDVMPKVEKLLSLIGEDIDFRDGNRRTMTTLIEEGKIPKAVGWEILKETSDREYLHELAKLYASRLNEAELDEAIAFLSVTSNRVVYRGLIIAFGELDKDGFEQRKKTLATRHPEAWKATQTYVRSEVGRKISKIGDESAPLRRECSIQAFLTAQKLVRMRLGIQEPPSAAESVPEHGK
jgi:hypothetical protein